jgi:acetylornithine/LysW-gamma-L-lysine aminotransferase
MFAAEHYQLEPDMMCLAKSIAGGVPMGAVLLGEGVGELSPGVHGTTFGGNPLACAASLTALEIITRDKLAQRAAELGDYALTRLREIDSPLIREVRGLGLMIGIEIRQKVAPYLQMLAERGVLALPAGLAVIRLLPPLVITLEQLDAVIDALIAVLTIKE